MTLLEINLSEILQEKQNKIIPENLKKGVTCLGVTGTLEASTSSGGVKQFSTVEEMNSSTGNTEGDLAVVYRNEIQNATVDSKFKTATFPETVVLDTAITDYVEVRYRAVDSSVMFDCMGQLDSSRFMMDCYTESGEIRIQYESSDGITYTRTDTTGNPVDFGTEIYYAMAERWNDAIGKFIQIGGSTFEGLYEYNDSSWVLAPTQLSAIADYVYGEEFYGKNGVETGALTTNVSNSFADTNAEIYKKIQKAYDDMTPRVLTDTDKTIDKNIYCIPTKRDGTVLLDTSSVTDMRYMFQNCTNLTIIPSLDTSSVTNMQSMFYGCTNLTTIPSLDTSSVTDMTQMFYNCSNLTTIPSLDTSSVTNMNGMFSCCPNLTTIPLLNTSSVTNMSYMFQRCTNLTEIPQLDTSNVTEMNQMFYGCNNLTEVPLLDTSKVTSFYQTFDNCSNLTAIPAFDTSNVTEMNYCFSMCTSLVTLPVLNTSKVKTMPGLVSGCSALSDDSLNNILKMCINATAYTGTKTLRYMELTKSQADKCTTLSNYSAFTAAGWTTGY